MENTSSKTNSFQYIAFFDLDLTLAGSISGKALAKEGYKRGLLSTSDILDALLISMAYRLQIRDPRRIVDSMIGWVRGIPANVMDEMCLEVYSKILIPSIFNDAITELGYHRTRKAKLVILSSSLKPVCAKVAQCLGIDDVICSELEIENGYLTGQPAGNLCFGEEKAVRLEEYCKKFNHNTSDAWYYGDSISDFPALICSGNPVCVNPDRKLKMEALKRGWKILKWKN